MSRSKNLEIIFAETASGKKPVEQWILDMSLTDRKKITAEIEKAKMFCQIGGGGNIKKITGDKNIWRIGFRLGNRNPRIFFFIINNTMVLLHGFFKRENRNYQKEIEVAASRKRRFINEYRK